MNHLKITDEAVSVACDAFLAANKANKTVGHKEIRAAIEAALPVMFEKAGYYTRSNSIYCQKPLLDMYLGKDIKVYRLKEPK